MRRNGELEHLKMATAVTQSEDDPPVLFGWIHIEPFVRQAVAAPPVAAGGAAIMCPFALPAPLTVATFKTALLNYLREPVAATQPIGTSVLPGNQRQYSVAVTATAGLNFDPWFMAVAGSAAGLVPIADVFCVTGRSVDNARSPVVRVAGAQLWN